MAAPPFDIAQLVPADNDIVAQFPLTERTYRDIVESWFLVDGNNMGRKNKVGFDFQGSSPTGTASVTTLWADTAGDLKYRVGTGAVSGIGQLGAPIGTVAFFAGTAEPTGWLFAYGQAVSRTTYAALFALIGTTYGAGDGSTTFNLPDLRGRVIAAKDDMGGVSANRLTGTARDSTVNGDILGGSGGAELLTIIRTDLENTSVTVGITDPGHAHINSSFSGGGFQLGTAGGGLNNGQSTTTATTGITAAFNLNGAVTQTTPSKVQPTFILNGMIKFA